MSPVGASVPLFAEASLAWPSSGGAAGSGVRLGCLFEVFAVFTSHSILMEEQIAYQQRPVPQCCK